MHLGFDEVETNWNVGSGLQEKRRQSVANGSCCNQSFRRRAGERHKHTAPEGETVRHCAVGGRLVWRGMCTYLLQIEVVTTRRAGPIGGGCRFALANVVLGAGFLDRFWRAKEIPGDKNDGTRSIEPGTRKEEGSGRG